MIDVRKETDRIRLMAAIDQSRQAMRVYRHTRLELIEDYVGSNYTEKGAKFKTLVNLLNQTANIYKNSLAANNPQVKVTPKRPELWPFAAKFETGINNLIKDLQLNDTLQEIVLDAFFCIGIAKVSMVEAGQMEIEQDVWYDPGKPWVERISPDDLIFDMTAKKLSKMRFVGDQYRASWEKVKENPAFDKSVVKRLAPTSKRTLKEGDPKAADIGSGVAVDDDELEPMIWLMDVWLPESKEVATFACDSLEPPLVVRPWMGAKGGPYKYLSYAIVPDNIIPSSPASNLKALHDLYNSLFRKMSTRAMLQKDNPTYRPGAEDDANRARTASDGQWIKANDPTGINVIRTGGVDQGLMALQLAIEQVFDRMGGNVKAKAGLGTDASTVGQEKIIQGNVSREELAMQLAVVNFTAEIAWELGYLMWNDSILNIEGHREFGESGVYEDHTWTPDQREGEFNHYDFAVDPFSMVYTTPEQKLQKLFSVLDKLAPMWPMLQASGLTIDGKAVVKDIADLLNEPRVNSWLTFLDLEQQAGELGGDQNTIRQSPVTMRETIRKSVPGGGSNQATMAQQALLAGVNQRSPGVSSGGASQ